MTKKKKPLSLDDYSRASRLDGCPVCDLPDDILAQVHAGSERSIPRKIILQWLTEKCGIDTVTNRDLTSHYSAHHKQIREELGLGGSNGQ